MKDSQKYLICPFKQDNRYVSYRYRKTFEHNAISNEILNEQDYHVDDSVAADQDKLSKFCDTFPQATGETDGKVIYIASDTADNRNKIYGSLRIKVNEANKMELTIHTHISEDGNIQMKLAKEEQLVDGDMDSKLKQIK